MNESPSPFEIIGRVSAAGVVAGVAVAVPIAIDHPAGFLATSFAAGAVSAVAALGALPWLRPWRRGEAARRSAERERQSRKALDDATIEARRVGLVEFMRQPKDAEALQWAEGFISREIADVAADAMERA